MIDAGKYDKRIRISTRMVKAEDGYTRIRPAIVVLVPHASVKTTRGMTLIANGSDFEKAYTNFTIRYPRIPITRDMLVSFKDKIYTIEYINNVDEACVELELQCKEISS